MSLCVVGDFCTHTQLAYVSKRKKKGDRRPWRWHEVGSGHECRESRGRSQKKKDARTDDTWYLYVLIQTVRTSIIRCTPSPE
jgi:hypothetical protein